MMDPRVRLPYFVVTYFVLAMLGWYITTPTATAKTGLTRGAVGGRCPPKSFTIVYSFWDGCTLPQLLFLIREFEHFYLRNDHGSS